MTTPRNDAALASPVYNPTIEPGQLELFQLLANHEPDEDLLEEYRTIVRNFPTRNPFTAALTNPRACEIDLVKTRLEEVLSLITDRYNGIVRDGTPLAPGYSDDFPNGYSPSPSQTTLLNEWNTGYPQIVNNFDTAGTGMTDYRDHTDRLISNFPSVVGIAQQSVGNQQALQGLLGASGGNPCIPFGDFLGTLLDAGRDIIDKILGALAGIAGAIMQPLQAIMGLVQQMMGAIAQAIQMLTQEITKLAMAMLNMARMGLAQLLSFLPNDPCLQSIIGGMLTGGASKVMSGIPGMNGIGGIGGSLGGIGGGLF